MKVSVTRDKPKLGILLPTRGILLKPRPALDAQLLMRLARQVESAGLDSVWVGDSLTAKPRLEAMAILAALAACTERVRLGTAVLLAGLRHPVLLAQAMATVDHISGGRLVVGAGVGGAFNDEQSQEWYAAGVDPKRRAGRFEEVLEIVQQLGQGEPVTFTGQHFSLDQVRMQPRTVQPEGVPVLLATHWRAQKERQLQRAARLGSGLMSITDSPEEYRELVQRTGEMVSSLGRDASKFENTYYMTVNVNRDVAKAEAEADEFLDRVLRGEPLGRPVGALRRGGENKRPNGGVRGGGGRYVGCEVCVIRAGGATGGFPGAGGGGVLARNLEAQDCIR